jgi:hypothetical protein
MPAVRTGTPYPLARLEVRDQARDPKTLWKVSGSGWAAAKLPPIDWTRKVSGAAADFPKYRKGRGSPQGA